MKLQVTSTEPIPARSVPPLIPIVYIVLLVNGLEGEAFNVFRLELQVKSQGTTVVPCIKLNVTLVGSIASLNVMLIAAFTAMPVLPLDGIEFAIEGMVVSAVPVLKLQLLSVAMWIPPASVTSLVIFTVYVAFIAKSTSGMKTAVSIPSHSTVPTICAVHCHNWNVATLMVIGSIGSLKVAVMELLIGIPAAPAAGMVDVTVGTVACGVPVVKSHV